MCKQRRGTEALSSFGRTSAFTGTVTPYFHLICTGLASTSARQPFWKLKQQHMSVVVGQGRQNGLASPSLVVSATVY